jgi:hypothetical protein
VRLGRDFDGGYVLPRQLVKASHALLSLGVESDWSFEEALVAEVPSLEVTCVDGTTSPEIIRTKLLGELRRAILGFKYNYFFHVVKSLLTLPSGFRRFFARHRFLPLMVAARPGPGVVTLPELLEQVGGTDPNRWVLLKMDIEGAEYEVLAAANGALAHVSGLVIEFHALEQNWARFESVMAELMKSFYVAHVHGNNFDPPLPGCSVPRTLELTLVNKALCTSEPSLSRDDYPLPGLDRPCNPSEPDLALCFD